MSLEGQVFTRLTVLHRAGDKKWACRCSCGTVVIVGHSNLRSGNSKSCGCLHKELLAARVKTHGATGTPEYVAWAAMIQRCEDQDHEMFHRYGGRGIKVASEWRHDFSTFLAHVGPRPSPSHSLDRMRVNEDYKPGNVRWATAREQANNKENTVYLTANGKIQSVAEWCDELGLLRPTVYGRKAKGWPDRRCLGLPPIVRRTSGATRK